VEASEDFCSEREVRDERMLHNVIKESQILRYEPEIMEMTGVSVVDSQQENRVEQPQTMFQRRQDRKRVPLSTLRFEEVVDPDMLQLFPVDVSPLSSDSLRKL